MDQRAAKVGHRKSRKGCSKCKIRRVKCDEVRPVCSNCSRLKLACSWPVLERGQTGEHGEKGEAGLRGKSETLHPSHPPHPSNPAHKNTRSPTGFSAASTDVEGASSRESAPLSALLRMWTPQEGDADVFLVPESVADEFSLPESRARRLMEHRLMQNYILHLSEPLPMSPGAEWNALWQKQLPPLALQHDNLLYALLAMSATSLLGAGEDESRKGDEHGSGDSSGSSSETSSGNSGAGSNVERKDLFTVRQAYLIAAMGEQRRMVQSLTLASADAVCLSSLLMLINAFAMLGERVVQPYTPPTEWLQLGRGSGAVVWLSVEAIQQSGEADRSVMCTIANAPPQFGLDESYFDASNREQFGALLATEATTASASEPSDPDDETTRLAYEQTLAYVGSIYKAIRRREPVYVISRRVQGFTMVVPPRFVDLVAASHPRALVVLAYFFAAVVQLSGVWWLGEGAGAGRNCIARRELRGIRSVLPDEWTGLMVWPLDIAGLM